MDIFDDEKVTLNLRGHVFQVMKSSLQSIPESFLAKLNYNSSSYDSRTKEYYFNRNPDLFQSVLDYCETGELHVPKSICSSLAKREFEYWGVGTVSLSKCCWGTFYENMSSCDVYEALQKHEEAYGYSERNTGASRMDLSQVGKVKRSIWSMILSPNSSIHGRIYYIFVLLNVCLSIVTFGLTTVESARKPRPEFAIANASWPNAYLEMYSTTVTIPELCWLDIVTNTCLLLDFLIRFFACPLGLKFLLSLFTIMDIVMFLSIYVAVYFELYPVKVENAPEMMKYFWIIGYIYIFRITRIFRLLYHTRGFKILHLCVSHNSGEFLFFIAIFLSVSSIFAAVIFNAEVYGVEPFDNIFVGLWWAVITLTSVGYGDKVPHTFQGQILGGIASVCGTLIVAIPMVVIASSYGYVYECFNTKRMHSEYVNQREKLTTDKKSQRT